jgi:hypothetical protein
MPAREPSGPQGWRSPDGDRGTARSRPGSHGAGLQLHLRHPGRRSSGPAKALGDPGPQHGNHRRRGAEIGDRRRRRHRGAGRRGCGHRGTFDGPFEAALIGMLALVSHVVGAVAVSVAAGIMDGRGSGAGAGRRRGPAEDSVPGLPRVRDPHGLQGGDPRGARRPDSAEPMPSRGAGPAAWTTSSCSPGTAGRR